MSEHLWNTVEEQYGWVSICEHCGKRESAEHSPECFRVLEEVNYDPAACICGATAEFNQYEAIRMAGSTQ